MMSGDALSQSKAKGPLSAVDSGAPSRGGPSPAAPGGPHRPPSAQLPPSIRDKVSPYDFTRPERVGKDQMRALQTLHEGLGRSFGAALSALLRSIVEMKLTSVDQLTYSEFVFGLENPTCFNVLKAEPLEGNLVLDINPSILYPIIDRLLGGGRESGPSARRPLTQIELRLVRRITDLFLEELHRAWENVIELDLAVVRVESNPQLVEIAAPNEVVVLISFELTVGDVRGRLNLCLPFNSIERIGGKLSSNDWLTCGRRQATPESIRQISRTLDGSLVEIVVRLAETRISTAEMIGLRVGDIITTEKDIKQPLAVEIEGVAKFHARPGAYKGHKAIRVEGPIAQAAQEEGRSKEEGGRRNRS